MTRAPQSVDVTGSAADSLKSFFAPSNVIAAISLIVAAFSVFISLQQNERAEVSQRRAELLDYVGKVAALSADRSGANHTFEIAAFTSQAAALLPEVSDVPATVYSQLAQAMITNADKFDEAEELLTEALVRAKADEDIHQQIYIHRLVAIIRYRDRDISGLREERRISVDLSDNYRGQHETTLRYEYAGFSLVFWATDEVNLGYCDQAERHLTAAAASARSAYSTSLDSEVVRVRKLVDSCRPVQDR